LWSWGYNSHGQLGQNNVVFYSSPVQVPGTTWGGGYSQISAGTFGTQAIKTDGTLWVWGNNANGRLGINSPTNTNYSSPVQVPGTTWSRTTFEYGTLAIKTDGTLWSWGYSSYGQLAQNNLVKYSSPTQIPGTTWNHSSTTANSSIATKTDGTLWTWGRNDKGQLGQNNETSYSSPVQVPGTTWDGENMFIGFRSAGVRKTDGTLWSWGYGYNGQLAQNNQVSYSSPVQVPGSDYNKFRGGNSSGFALKVL